jgi:hypothetical protein
MRSASTAIRTENPIAMTREQEMAVLDKCVDLVTSQRGDAGSGNGAEPRLTANGPKTLAVEVVRRCVILKIHLLKRGIRSQVARPLVTGVIWLCLLNSPAFAHHWDNDNF